jgi:hypothetical protein
MRGRSEAFFCSSVQIPLLYTFPDQTEYSAQTRPNKSRCRPPLDEVNNDVNPVGHPQASRAAANDRKVAYEPSSLGDSKALIIVRPSTTEAAQGRYRVTISLWFCLTVATCRDSRSPSTLSLSDGPLRCTEALRYGIRKLIRRGNPVVRVQKGVPSSRVPRVPAH